MLPLNCRCLDHLYLMWYCCGKVCLPSCSSFSILPSIFVPFLSFFFLIFFWIECFYGFIYHFCWCISYTSLMFFSVYFIVTLVVTYAYLTDHSVLSSAIIIQLYIQYSNLIIVYSYFFPKLLYCIVIHFTHIYKFRNSLL